MPTKVFFVTDVWRRNPFSKLLLKRFWKIWPLTQTLIGYLCHPGWMCGPSLRRVGQCILELLSLKSFWHFWPRWPWPLIQWSQDSSVPLLPRMDVWTQFEDGRSRRSRVIYWKRKGYRRTEGQTYRQTDWPTCAKQYALSSLKGGITTDE